MARLLTVENDTHWRSKDVRRIVRGAMDAAGFEQTKPMVLTIDYASDGMGWVPSFEETNVTISLPKKGTAKPHPVALVALASAGVDSGTPLLPCQDVFRIANALSAMFARLVGGGTGARFGSITPPAWGSNLFIAKYADPTKDAGFVAFCAKAQAKIDAAQARVEKWTTEKERAEKNLKRAERDLRAAQRSIRDAKKRRGI